MNFTIYVLKFNNYYNRIVKVLDSVNQYLQEALVLGTAAAVNFNPNDGILTQHVVRYDDGTSAEPDDPDYAIVVDDQNKIVSRWFVMEATRLAKGQYKLILKRDVLADNIQDVLNAPAFIEKGYVGVGDSAIYNNEGVLVNQIKRRESPLIDETGGAWIVGYMARNAVTEDVSISTKSQAVIPANIQVEGIENWAYYDYIGEDIIDSSTITSSVEFEFKRRALVFGSVHYYSCSASATKTDVTTEYIDETSSLSVQNGLQANALTIAENIIFPIQSNWSTLETYVSNYIDSRFNELNFPIIKYLRGKIVLDVLTNSYYRIEFYDKGEHTIEVTDSDANSWMVENCGKTYQMGENPPAFVTRATYSTFTISLEPVLVETTTTISSQRNHLYDAPYDMFAIPYQNVQLRFSNGASPITVSNPNIAVDMAQSIAEDLGEGVVYDIQIVPYCPVRELLDNDGVVNVYRGSFSPISQTNRLRSAVIWCQYSRMSFSLSYSSKDNTLCTPMIYDPIEYKVEAETTFNRLCSPNYNGVFEFSPYKNKGVDAWDIDITYKPYMPYIHVAPHFNSDGLYGGDYNDVRGLTCGGEFSLTQTRSAWETYELNNKTYQQAFDRQIETMEISHDVQREQQIWGIAAGTAGALMGGATSGAIAGGGGIGAGIGAGVSGALSLAGGIRDYQLSEVLRKEAIDYTKDQFSFNLQNIRALPNSLMKITALNPNNKIFPFVEYYSATDEEKTALRNKIRYNGMRIDRVGIIGDYLALATEVYIKGKLIRLENIGDGHVVDEIAQEFNKGFFYTITRD